MYCLNEIFLCFFFSVLYLALARLPLGAQTHATKKKEEFICTKQQNRRRTMEKKQISAEREMKIKFENSTPTTYTFGSEFVPSAMLQT